MNLLSNASNIGGFVIVKTFNFLLRKHNIDFQQEEKEEE